MRFSKHLVSDCYSDFCGNLRGSVGKLRAGEPSSTHRPCAWKWQGLAASYGVGVSPPRFQERFDCGVDSWALCLDSHSGDQAPATLGSSTPCVGVERAQAWLFEILRVCLHFTPGGVLLVVGVLALHIRHCQAPRNSAVRREAVRWCRRCLRVTQAQPFHSTRVGLLFRCI